MINLTPEIIEVINNVNNVLKGTTFSVDRFEVSDHYGDVRIEIVLNRQENKEEPSAWKQTPIIVKEDKETGKIQVKKIEEPIKRNEKPSIITDEIDQFIRENPYIGTKKLSEMINEKFDVKTNQKSIWLYKDNHDLPMARKKKLQKEIPKDCKSCPECDSTRLTKDGLNKNKIQRYKCRDCKRKFTGNIKEDVKQEEDISVPLPHHAVSEEEVKSLTIAETVKEIENDPNISRIKKDVIKYKAMKMSNAEIKEAIFNDHKYIIPDTDIFKYVKELTKRGRPSDITNEIGQFIRDNEGTSATRMSRKIEEKFSIEIRPSTVYNYMRNNAISTREGQQVGLKTTKQIENPISNNPIKIDKLCEFIKNKLLTDNRLYLKELTEGRFAFDAENLYEQLGQNETWIRKKINIFMGHRVLFFRSIYNSEKAFDLELTSSPLPKKEREELDVQVSKMQKTATRENNSNENDSQEETASEGISD